MSLKYRPVSQAVPYQIPRRFVDLAERRCEGIVRCWATRMSQGSIWVLVASCYVQGIKDALDAQSHRKEPDIEDEP